MDQQQQEIVEPPEKSSQVNTSQVNTSQAETTEFATLNVQLANRAFQFLFALLAVIVFFLVMAFSILLFLYRFNR